MKTDKCSLFQSLVQYLGHVIDKDGIQPSEEKIKSIQDMLISTNQAELGSFLGMVMYFSQFFPRLFDHTAPLGHLLEKNMCLGFGPVKLHAPLINTTQRSLPHHQLVLPMYNLDQPLFLACDGDNF